VDAAIFKVDFTVEQTDDRSADSIMVAGMMASPYKTREL
jgi:hypothetical protein